MLEICLITSGWEKKLQKHNSFGGKSFLRPQYKMASIKDGWRVESGWVVAYEQVLTISTGIYPTQSAHPCPRGRILWAPCRWTVVSLACLFCGGGLFPSSQFPVAGGWVVFRWFSRWVVVRRVVVSFGFGFSWVRRTASIGGTAKPNRKCKWRNAQIRNVN